MESKEEGEGHEEQASPSSCKHVPEEESGKTLRLHLQPLQSGTSDYQGRTPKEHRRRRSEVPAMGNDSDNGFQRLKNNVYKAWRWGGNRREERHRSTFNPEVLANQKRQWYKLNSRNVANHIKCEEPQSMFEHFIIAGIHPDANLGAVEEAFAKRKKWEAEMTKFGHVDHRVLQHRGPPLPKFEPQILFKYPPGKKLAMRPKDITAFCFPGGVKARMLRRTPSFSDLNELLYGQEHLSRDDLAFVFSLKVAGNATLYGVCLHVVELVQRRPGILSVASPTSLAPGHCSQFMVSAPRCYCLLTRVPFFDLHYEMLNSIIAQERLNRIIEFASEMSMSLTDYAPSDAKLDEEANDDYGCPKRKYVNDWMASCIPVNSAVALTASAAGVIADHEVASASMKISSPQSTESVAASDTSDLAQVREVEEDVRKNMQYVDDDMSEASDNQSDASERISGNCESGQFSPGSSVSSMSQTLEHFGSSQSLFSPARSVVSVSDYDDEDDDIFFHQENDFGDDLYLKWARENKNELLQMVAGYHALSPPPRGGKTVFQPLEHLQAIEYVRPSVSALGMDENSFCSFEAAEVNGKLAAAEEATALSTWTTGTICRVLSLDNILALVAGVLLEKQVVVICPNLGVLSAVLLSLVPMIRPFQYQSLMLPVLPERMLDFLDAPVPFLVGVQHKPTDLKIRASNIVQVNIVKNQVKTYHLPALPRRRELLSELGPIHARMSYEGAIGKRHPTYKCNEVQAEAANQFLTVMRNYLESFCENLRSHTITCVESNNDKVSLLLKDSYIDSFPKKDQPFVKQFIDTQLFTVLSDLSLASIENEN